MSIQVEEQYLLHIKSSYEINVTSCFLVVILLGCQIKPCIYYFSPCKRMDSYCHEPHWSSGDPCYIRVWSIEMVTKKEEEEEEEI